MIDSRGRQLAAATAASIGIDARSHVRSSPDLIDHARVAFRLLLRDDSAAAFPFRVTSRRYDSIVGIVAIDDRRRANAPDQREMEPAVPSEADPRGRVARTTGARSPAMSPLLRGRGQRKLQTRLEGSPARPRRRRPAAFARPRRARAVRASALRLVFFPFTVAVAYVMPRAAPIRSGGPRLFATRSLIRHVIR